MPAKVTDSILAAISEANAAFTEVVEKRNLELLDGLYAADARVLPPGAEMIQGRDAIKAFWGRMIAGLASMKLVTVDAQMIGDAVVEIGRAEVTLGDGRRSAAKYVVIWKQEDGRWKLNVDIWNTNDQAA